MHSDRAPAYASQKLRDAETRMYRRYRNLVNKAPFRTYIKNSNSVAEWHYALRKADRVEVKDLGSEGQHTSEARCVALAWNVLSEAAFESQKPAATYIQWKARD